MPRWSLIVALFAGLLVAAARSPVSAQDDGRYPLFEPEVLQLPTAEDGILPGSGEVLYDAGFLPPPMGEENVPPGRRDLPYDAAITVPPGRRDLPYDAAIAFPPGRRDLPLNTATHVDEVIVPASGPFPWWKPWEGSFELGMNGTSGNMETFNLRIGAKAKRASLKWVHLAEFTHIDKTNNHKTIAYNLLFDARVERLFPHSAWSLYWHGLTEYDEFKAFNVRLSTDTGVAYLWYKTDVSKLLTRFGPSVSHEIGGPNKRYTPELTTGLELQQAFNARNKMVFSSDYFPSVVRFSDYRVNTRASWEVIVAPMWGVSLKFSLIDRFDSTPGLNRQRNDIDYSLLAMWSY